jgi:hypothetical protein
MSALLVKLFEFLFGCSHNRTTFPLTVRSSSVKPGQTYRGTYVACLDCGREFGYDWNHMRMESTPAWASSRNNTPSLVTNKWNTATSRGKAA